MQHNFRLGLRAAAILYFRSSRVSEDTRRGNMYRFAKAAVNISSQAARQVRNGSTVPQDFHSKYGTGLMVGGGVFCTAVWAYVLTQTGITWNLSPVGKVQPKPWREAEEE
ncbi:cytochrome c oxidase subunit 7B, mitochondrial [Acanthochromis polyacanthus]|uniref:cytochrome c oxidase subunit 7B, mitochondrial n=1 Tax=Acanthochromis polyacanthus TaxID=80966 RepID=UPI0022347075|nr:cytochrome c oxidase subunit 7B, mitochondrial [Acanthochromis polyacanthus]